MFFFCRKLRWLTIIICEVLGGLWFHLCSPFNGLLGSHLVPSQRGASGPRSGQLPESHQRGWGTWAERCLESLVFKINSCGLQPKVFLFNLVRTFSLRIGCGWDGGFLLRMLCCAHTFVLGIVFANNFPKRSGKEHSPQTSQREHAAKQLIVDRRFVYTVHIIWAFILTHISLLCRRLASITDVDVWGFYRIFVGGFWLQCCHGNTHSLCFLAAIWSLSAPCGQILSKAQAPSNICLLILTCQKKPSKAKVNGLFPPRTNEKLMILEAPEPSVQSEVFSLNLETFHMFLQ